jgi:hypothetical protein
METYLKQTTVHLAAGKVIVLFKGRVFKQYIKTVLTNINPLLSKAEWCG